MTTRSSSTCSDDSLIRPTPVTAGARALPVRVLTRRSAPPSGARTKRPPGAVSGAPREAAVAFAHDVVPEAAPGSVSEAAPESVSVSGADGRYDDPLLGLVRTAVTTRPLEDVVRLITLLEGAPEHTRTLAEAVRSAGLDRSVADVTRLAALLTRPPRTPAGADAVLRAAAGQRPVDEVGMLLRLLYRTPLEPRCRQTAVQAAATGRTVGELTVGGSVAMAAGPVLGGLLTESAGWRAVFLLNLPVGAVILGLLTRVPRSPRRPAALDGFGQLTAVLALAGLAVSVIEGGHLGWTSLPVLGAGALAVVSGFVFRVVESRHRQPMIPPALLRERRVAVPLAVGFAVNAAFYGGIFLLGLHAT
ncbi:MFS transporter, partial [Streptomyces murinus]|uniref:MFS transporter n=1 Tax=Streptomyces murinus TaxID=33900 RepID=UPI003F47F095